MRTIRLTAATPRARAPAHISKYSSQIHLTKIDILSGHCVSAWAWYLRHGRSPQRLRHHDHLRMGHYLALCTGTRYVAPPRYGIRSHDSFSPQGMDRKAGVRGGRRPTAIGEQNMLGPLAVLEKGHSDRRETPWQLCSNTSSISFNPM